MSKPVRATNDMSFGSKLSMVREGYVVDEAVTELAAQLFRKAPPRRAPLVHLGYFLRHRIVGYGVDKFVDRYQDDNFQVLSLGAGFDTTYFRLKKTRGAACSPRLSYYEVDLPDVVRNKITLISNSKELSSLIINPTTVAGDSISLQSHNYSVFSHDLNKLEDFGGKLERFGFDFSQPTLVLSECAITYMEERSSTRLIEWAASNLPLGCFLTYEQVRPDDAFGRLMSAHFHRVQAPLKSLPKYRSPPDQRRRYLDSGWAHCRVYSAISLIWQIDKSWVESCKIEPFDEWEELFSTGGHYSLSVASHSAGFLCDLGFEGDEDEDDLNEGDGEEETEVSASPLADSFLERFGHKCLRSSPSGDVVVVGGEPRHSSPSNTLNCVHHSCTLVATNQYVLYGGRTSPLRDVYSEPVLLRLRGSTIETTPIEMKESGEGRPQGRWRHSAVAINGGLFIFGGRNARLDVLSDLWEMKLTLSESSPGGSWVRRNSGESGPCPRFSQAMAVSADGAAAYLSGGLDSELSPLKDIWRLTVESDVTRWELLRPVTSMRPVFSHTMHSANNKLLFVGGVSSQTTELPQLTVLDLVSLQLQHFSLNTGPSYEPPLLHNHDSELGKVLRIYGGGGNCFTFGTHFNRRWLDVRLSDIGLP